MSDIVHYPVTGGRVVAKGAPTGVPTYSLDQFLSSLAELPREVTEVLLNLLGEFIDGPREIGDLLRCELIAVATGGTLELRGIQILPSDVFFELIGAFARDCEDITLTVSHGWPILSLGSDNPSVTDAGRESISAG